MTGREILERAFTFKDYVYWYGGKGQLCTEQLLNQLAKQNPGIYTESYKKKARKDIMNGKKCIDCSGLICEAYGISHIGSSQIKDEFITCDINKALPGYVVWRPGHVGILIDEGHTIEAKGIDYDVSVFDFRPKDWKLSLFLPNVEYERTYSKGWHTDDVGRWYAYGEYTGCYYKNCLKKIDGMWYYFNSDGYVV